MESGATLKAEQIKTDTERFGKQYDAIQHQADETNKLVDTLKLTKGLMDQPSFYSGAGAEFVQSAKRIGVALGLTNPSEAQAMEAFGKTVSSAVMDQIRSLGGQGLGQVRVAEIKIMERAAQNHDNTPASNRLLTEMQMRMAANITTGTSMLASTRSSKTGSTSIRCFRKKSSTIRAGSRRRWRARRPISPKSGGRTACRSARLMAAFSRTHHSRRVDNGRSMGGLYR